MAHAAVAPARERRRDRRAARDARDGAVGAVCRGVQMIQPELSRRRARRVAALPNQRGGPASPSTRRARPPTRSSCARPATLSAGAVRIGTRRWDARRPARSGRASARTAWTCGPGGSVSCSAAARTLNALTVEAADATADVAGPNAAAAPWALKSAGVVGHTVDVPVLWRLVRWPPPSATSSPAKPRPGACRYEGAPSVLEVLRRQGAELPCATRTARIPDHHRAVRWRCGLSLRYPIGRLILVEKYHVIAEFGGGSSARVGRILSVPCVDHVDDLPATVSQGARWLVGFCMPRRPLRHA